MKTLPCPLRGAALFLAFLVSALCGSAAFAADAPDASKAPKKPLVVYFSRTGHTEAVAKMIHDKVGGDILRIETVEPYPADYHATTEVAKKQQEENARPAIKTSVPNIDDYGVVFLGYPNWWSSMPMPVYTFVEQNKLDGKTIAPFTTHGGGGLGHSVDDLKKLVPHSKILKPFSVSGNRADSALKDVEKWLEGLGPALIMTTTGNPAIYPDGGY